MFLRNVIVNEALSAVCVFGVITETISKCDYILYTLTKDVKNISRIYTPLGPAERLYY